MIKIDNYEVEASNKITIEKNLTEERDFGNIQVYSNRSVRYETNSFVDIEESYLTEYLLIQSDEVNHYSDDIWEHNITLYENIARFDSVYPADRVFTKLTPGTLNTMTIGEILEVYRRELLEFHSIRIEFDTEADWANVSVPHKEYAGLNFSSILSDLFKKIDAIPKANRNSTTYEIYPQYKSLRNNLIEELDPHAETQINKSADYATMIKAQIKNALHEGEYEEAWFPSETGYVKPKYSSIKKKPSNLRWELDSSMIYPIEFIATGVEVWDILEGQPAFIDIDITKYLITEEELATKKTVGVLSVYGSDNTRLYVLYNPGEKYIYNLWQSDTDKFLFFFDQPTNFIFNAIYMGWATNEYLWGRYSPPNEIEPEDVKMRIRYVRQRNLDISQARQFKGYMNKSTQINNQSSSEVELSQFKNSLKNYANRLANPENIEVETLNIEDTPKQLGDYTVDNRVVTQVMNTYENNTIYSQYKMTKNFSNLNSEYALSRDPSPYTISRKRVQTNVIFDEYIEMSNQKKDNDSLLTEEAIQTILKTIINDQTDLKLIRKAVFRPDRPIEGIDDEVYINGILMQVWNSAGGNTMSFHVFFDKQRSAGYDYRTDYGQPIVYTLDDGSLEDFYLFFTEELAIEDDGRYPLNQSISTAAAAAMTNVNKKFPIDLDPQAAFAFTYQLHSITDNEQYILGDALTRYNFLIKKPTFTEDTKVYQSNKPYTMFDKEPRPGDYEIGAATLAMDYEQRELRIVLPVATQYISLVNNGEILVAINEWLYAGTNKYYFNIVKEPEDLYAEGTGTYDRLIFGAMTATFEIDVNVTEGRDVAKSFEVKLNIDAIVTEGKDVAAAFDIVFELLAPLTQGYDVAKAFDIAFEIDALLRSGDDVQKSIGLQGLEIDTVLTYDVDKGLELAPGLEIATTFGYEIEKAIAYQAGLEIATDITYGVATAKTFAPGLEIATTLDYTKEETRIFSYDVGVQIAATMPYTVVDEAPGGGCLDRNTLIPLWDGTIKPLHEIAAGDILIGYTTESLVDESVIGWQNWNEDDITAGEKVPVEVKSAVPDYFNEYYIINEAIRITQDHPIMIRRKGTWMWLDARDVLETDTMHSINGAEVEVTSIRKVEERIDVVTLDVEPTDNYFAADILVHNEFTKLEN